MDILITLEQEERKQKKYWSAKLIHMDRGAEHATCLMEIQSDKFDLGNEKEYVRTYENVTIRTLKEIMKNEKLRTLLLYNNVTMINLKQA